MGVKKVRRSSILPKPQLYTAATHPPKAGDKGLPVKVRGFCGMDAAAGVAGAKRAGARPRHLFTGKPLWIALENINKSSYTERND